MAEISAALARLRRDPLAGDVRLDPLVGQLCRQASHVWRERLLPPLVTLRLFILQILLGNTAINNLRQKTGLNFAASSYCEARARLPLAALQALLAGMVDLVISSARKTCQAARVFLVDASSFSMPDTLELREQFGLPKGTCAGVEGVAYPVAKIIALLDLATGIFTRVLAQALYTHEFATVSGVHDFLKAGDILVGDRGFSSYVHLAMLWTRGVYGCFRLHQKRKYKSLGLQQWNKPKTCPKWMDLIAFTLLPATLQVRLVKHRIGRPGYRTQEVVIATTLLDEQAWPDEKIAELFGCRWRIETCFDHIKTTMKMNVLKCQTVDGVMKELAVYLLVYNLVWLAMLRAAERQ
ncbi:MAG: IS4 family transposase, partial [Tepidisphaerales bacterium]